LRNFFLILFFIFSAFFAFNQNKKTETTSSKEKVNNDTVYVELDEIKVFPQKTIVSEKDKKKFDRLVMYVKSVYPLAKIVEVKYHEYEQLLAGKSDKEKKRLMKQAEEEIKNQYYDQITDLTFTQGRILLKLIDRETQRTPYDLLKDYRGMLRAVFWQSIARIFGANLKSEFHPESDIEDRNIEEIITLIESGMI